MNRSDFEHRLQQRLRRTGRGAVALGIDLGTTKSCVAFAAYDPSAQALRCECVRYRQADGSLRAAVPSAVAVEGPRTWFGAAALARRGERGFRPERNLFYETKNEIGLRYTYARAPQGFGNAGEVAARLLEHLRESIDDPLVRSAAAPLVATVPASFHGAQRLATVRAAETAFALKRKAGRVRLLDEPYAAFLDLLLHSPERAAPLLRGDGNLMVFDFGGGTCDVAIFRRDAAAGGALGARLLGTSRYHRLGGGDVDRAIVHDVLMPALFEQNGLERWDASWFEKRKRIEPQLLGVAERLKVALSEKLAGATANADAADQRVEVDTLRFEAEIGGVVRPLTLTRPGLRAIELEELLEPFLDPEPPPEAGDEYVQRSSIFSPVWQALCCAELEPEDIDGILLCGSSSLLPPVRQALAQAFPNAALALHGAAEELEGAVARGAALQALSWQLLGEPLIAAVCSAGISLKVATGSVALLSAGATVPAGSAAPVLLRPARDSRDRPVEIAVEAVADGQRIVGRSLWHLPAPVSIADRLALDWRMDENQCMELNLHRLGDADTAAFVERFDAPIAHRDMGQTVRCRMLERCEAIRTGNVPREDLGGAYQKIAHDCAALGEYERALHFVRLALQEKGDSPILLSLRGTCRDKIGDRQGARDSYARASAWSGASFNLALLELRDGRYEQAMQAIDAAIENEPLRAYRVLRGDILDKLGRCEQARVEWQDAVAGQPNWSRFGDFDLDWLERASRALGQDGLRERIRAERKRLAQRSAAVTRQGELPEFVSRVEADPTEQV